MNKGRYRLVYSEEHGSYVPVPEETSARSKGQGGRALRRLVAAMAAALPGLSIANPTGHQVMQGQVGIQQQGGTLNITASDKAIIHWKQFSIQPGETTRFIQPNATATVLNRVVGQDPSQILGNLIANGRVFLINPNGVLFGAGAKVDTAGLVASTLNIKNEDFNAGRLKFEAEGAAGKIRNEGSLKTTGGPLLLIATDVENTGLITAENGDIVLAAGKSVEIADPHQPALRVRIEAGGEAINLGQLIAKGGNAGMFGAALTQAGKISATGAQRTADGRIVLRGTKSVTLTETSETTARTADGNGGAIEISAPEVKIEAKAVVDASGIQGGRIDVTAGQRATVDGTLRATGKLPAPPAAAPAPADIEMPVTAAGPAPAPAVQPVADAGKGGHIQVTADTVVIGGSATLDASGDTGGGSVLVGGDWQGANPLVRNAQVSWVGSGARLLADALLDGDGGKVVVWADQASAFHGNIWARGGRDGGNGGQVEVSGKVALLYRGRTDTSAARGRNGSLLLDPLSIVIQGGSGDGANDGNLSYNGGTAGTITAESLGPTVVYESELEEQSKTTDIILRAQRSVTVGNAQFNYTASGNASGETAGQLTLATGSSLLIETRNLGAGEGGVSAGIDLVTGGWHGAGLRIVTQGSGSITMQTGYSNGTQVGDQRADIVLPVLQTASGGILARAGSTSVIDLRGISYRSGGTISMQAGTVSGGTAFNAAGGTEITGNYLLSGGTVSFDGGNASISGLLTLNGNLGGASALSLGGLLWQGGQMLAGGRVTLNGAGQIDGSNAYRYLDRRLDVAGQFDLANSTGYELIVRNGGELHLNAGATLSSTTADGMIRLAAGTGGSALLSGDAGSRIAIAAGRSLQLNTDSAAGSTIAGQFDTSGDGALIVANGRLSTAADTTFTGSGILRLLNGGTLSGSHRLALGNRFEWQGGLLDGSGTTVLSGTGVVDNSSSYHYLARTLQVDGTLTLGNSSGYLLYINDGGRLHLGATGTLSTDGSAAYIYMNAGATGVARLSGDTGARVVIGDGAQLYLRTDNTGGNRLSGTLNIGGAGVLTLDSGSVSITDTALLTGSGTVRLSNGGDIGGAGTLTLAANFDWRGGSMSNAAGTTILAGSSSIDNTSGYKYIGRRVVLTGSLTMGNSSGYYLQIHNGGNLHLAAGSRLATSTASGMIYLAAGTGGAALSADAGSVITAAAGTVLTFQSDGNAGNTLAGRFTFDGAGEVRMPSGQFTTAAATTFAGSGLLRLNGATLNLLHATEFASPLVFESGIIAGSGSVLLSGDSRWTSGTMSGTGTTTVTGRLQIDNNAGYKFLGRQLVIDSRLDFGASTGYYLQLNSGGTLHLNAGATLNTGNSSTVIYMAAGSGGVATLSADDGARVAAASGADLFLRTDSSSGNRIAGNFELTGAGDLVLDSGVLQTGAATMIDGIGRLRLSGSATLNAEHALSINSVFRFDGGVLGGSAATTLSGAFTWAGGTMAGTGTTTIAGSGTVDNTAGYKFLNRRLTVTGSLMFGNSSGYYLQLNNGGRLHVAANATLGTSSADGVIYLASGSGGSALISADSGSNIQLATGTTLVLRADNAGNNGIAGNFNLTGNGTLHLDSGTLSADAATAFTGDGRLLLSGGGTLAGSGLITIASVFDWTGGSMAGTGTTRLLRDVSLSGSGARHLNRTLEIAAGRTLSLGDNVTLQRSTSNGGTGGIVAQGTLLKSAGTGTAYVTYLDLSGNIASSSGVLSIYGNAVGTSLNGVNASTSGSGALRLDSGLFTLTNGQTFTVSGGRAELSGATLSTSGSTSITGGGVFALTAGTLNGTGTLNVTSGFDWTGGTMSGTGTTRLDTSVTLTGSGTRTLDRTLEIAAGRTLDLDDNVLIQRSTSSGGTGGVVALGTVRKAGGTGTAYLRYLDLSGNISANRGVLSIYGNSAGSRIAGAVLSSNGGSLRADTGTLLLNAGESAQIASGTFELSGATLTATGNSSLDGAGTFSFTSGTINGPGTLTVNTATDWTGGNMAGSGITRLAGAARILSGSTRGLGRTLEIAGSTVASNLSGAVQIQDGARISVLSGGTLELNNSAVFSHLGSGRIDNAGLLLKTGSDSASLAMPVGNTGTLRVAEGSLSANGFTTNAGTLDLRAGSTLATGSLQNNGVIQGSGTINLGAGTLTNTGIVRPGDASGTGTLTVTGQFVQTAGGRIEADVLGATAAQQDHLVVSGSAQLDGALVLTPANGLTFGASDRYTVLSCGADGCLSGAFASVNTGGLAVTPTTFSNAISFATGTIASTWISQTSGFWDVAANWAGGLIPTASTDVVIDQAGDLTVTVRATSPASNFTVNSLRSNENIAITGSTLTLRGDSVINGRLSMTGGTLTIGSQLEVGAMTLNGGTVSGGRLIAAGTGNVLGNGTLSALQLMLGSRLTSTGNGTLSNVTVSRLGSGSDAGRIVVANGSDLRVAGTLTLDNASVTLASDGSSTFLRSTSGAWSIAGNGSILFGGSHNAVRASNYLGYGSGSYSLSIGAGVTVAGSNGGYIYFGNNGANAGTIEAATAGREIVVNAWNNTDTWNNTGTLRANGGMLSLNDAWSSAGNGARIQLDSGTLFLGGSFSTASFNTLFRPADADRGALNLVGTLNNANATLNLNGATGTLNSGGTIAGGTLAIDNASGGAFNTGYAGVSGSSFGGSNSAALDNVRLSGSTTVANGGDLRVIGTLTLDNGSVTLASDSSSTFLRSTSGAWSIAGNGSILFGGSHNAVRASNYLGYGSGAYSLSIGAGVTVAGSNGGYIYFGDNGANAGLIEAVTAGKEISLNAWSSNSSWTQSGTLHLANGGQFHVGDNFINSGVLRGAGNINASGRTITSTGLVHAEGGVLSVTGNLTQAAGSTLRFDIGGTERGTGHSALDVNGTFTFGGTLQVVHTNGFTPAASEAFPLIRYATRAGTSQFATLDVPAGSGYGSYYGAGTYLLARGAALNGEINEWISNASGDWSTGTNWSLGVAPNSATMSVLMDRVGFTPTVTISSGSWTIGELISQEHLTMTGGSLTVIGETAIAGQLTLNNASQLLAQGHLDLGTVTLNGSSQFIARNSGHIAEYRQNGGTSTFSGAGLAFDVFDIRGGTVNYDATLALPSQLLRIANYTANLNADQGQTLIQLQSGTLNLNLGSLSSDLDMSGGTLNVASNTVSNGRLDWTGGNINGSGTLTQNGVMTVGGNGSFGLGGGITLVHTNSSGNSRMAKTGSYFYLNGSGTTLRNAAGAVLTLDSTDNTFGTYYSGGTGGLLQNQGTLIKTGAGVFRVNSPTRFEQAGLLDIRAGSIDLSYSTGNVFSGNTLIAADSALTLTGSQSTAFTGSARFSGAGLIQQNSGSTGIADGARIDSSLRLAGGTLGVTGTVRQNGAFTWTGGEINGGGTLAVSGVLEQSGNTTVYLRDATTLLHSNTSGNSRIANTSSSGLNIDSGSVFRNTGTLTLDVAGSGSIMYIDQDSGNAGLFDNTGTLIKTGSGRVDIGTYGLVSLRQAGALTINEGWMTLGGSGGTPPAHQISGSQSIASGALLQVTSGQAALASSAAFAGAGRLEVAGGTLTIGDGVQLGSDLALALSNGTLSVVGQLQQNSRFTWTGGQINGGGTLAVAGVFEQTGNTTVYLRDGTTLLHTNTSGDSRIANTSSSGFNIENGSTFRNTGTLKLDVASASGVMYIDQDGGNAGLFDNAGTLIKTGAGRLDIGTYGLVSLRQTGTLNVNAGWITFGGSGGTPPEHLLAGTQTIAAGARIDIDGGRTRLASSAVVSGAGPLRLTGGVLAMDDGMTTGITLQQSGGTLSGTGSNTLSGRYEWTGGTVGGSGVLTVSGALQISGSGSFGLDGRSLRHTNAAGSSSIYKTGGYLYVSNGATFTNAAGAALYIDTAGGNSGVWYGGTAGSFVNDGLLVKQGNGAFNFWNPVRLSNTGTLTVAQGTLFADNFTSNSGTLHTLSGAVLNTGNTALTNTGTVSGHGTLVIGGTGLLNRGIVAPGGSNEDGTLRITGHYTQAADGTLQIERGTPGTDALVVSGTATLGGTLTVSSLTGYTPTTLQSDIVSAGTLTGSFSTVTLPSGYSTLAVGNRQVLSYAGAICGGICWDGGAGTNLWTDAANWTGDLLPGLTSLVFIDLQNGVSVLLNSGTHTVASLTTTAGNTLTLAGGSLTLSGGAFGQNASTLAGNLNISGGTLTANAATSIARLALSAGTLGGSGAITFNGAGSSWTGGDITGSGNTILAAGSTLDYAAGTRSTARRLDIRQGGTLRHLSGVLTLTGGASNAGVIDVAQGVTARYGGSATYLLDSSGQFAGGGRIEFINSAQATAASTAPTIAESTFTVRVQDSARFTATAPTAIARLELADSAQVIAQAGLQAGTLTQTGGTLTVNAASAVGQYSWAGGTLAGTGALTLLGNGSWTRGTLSGNLVIGNGATLTLSSTGSDDVQGTSYKRFGTGSLSNFGTLAWQEGHIDVVGNARVDNHGLLDISGNFSFGDRSVGVGTITLNNHAGALIRKNGGGETSIGSLGIPGGTANYAVVTNDGEILVGSGSLRFGVGYAGAPGGGSFIHNGQIDVVAGALLEFGGSLTHNGYTFIDSGATLRRIGGFTNTANGTIQGFGTMDVGNGNTLRNDGTLQVGDVFNGVNTHGTMQVTGNYLQGSGGRLLMAVGGNTAGQYDRLAVSGSATLGGSLVVSEAAGYARDSVAIDLITANGGLSGSLATVTLPFEGYTVAQGANALRLNYAAIVCGGICWDGGAGTNLWTDAANWTGNVLPGLNDLVFINLGAGGQVRLTGGDQRIAALNTGAGSTLTISGGALTITGLSGSSSVASAVAGDVVLTGGTLTVGGQASFASLRQSGGFSQFDGIATVSRLALSGGEGVTLRTNGRLTVSDDFDWRDQADLDGAGTFTTAGLTTVTGSGGLGFGISVDWHNTGTVNLANGALLHFYSTSDGNGGALINEAGGVIDLSGGNALALGTHSGPLSRFVNAGMLIKRSGGDQRLEGNYSFENLGTVQVDGGRLDIRVSNADGGADTGRYISNATLAFGAGQRILAAGSDITGNGAVEFSGARVTVNGDYGIAGTGNTRISAGRADFASALTFANTLIVRGGVLNFNGDTVLNRLEMGWSVGDPATYAVLGGTGALTFTGSNSTITDGTLASGVVSGYDTALGPLYVQMPTAPRTVTVASGASLTVGGSQYADLSGIALNNQGTLSLVDNIHVHLDNTLDNAGRLELGSASAALGQIADVAWVAPGSLLIRNTGELVKQQGNDAFAAATLISSGTVELAAGTLRLGGNYVQDAAGTLVSVVGSAGPSRLHVDGSATLGGTLEVREAAGYNRMALNNEQLVRADGGISGAFTARNLPTDYTLSATPNRLNLNYTLLTCGGICWDGGAGTSNWMDAANWTGDLVPGIDGLLDKLVFINLATGANVVLNASPMVTIPGLTIGNGNSFTLNSGVLNAPTTVQAGGTMTLQGGALNASQLSNSGTMNLSGSVLTAGLITNNGTMNLLAGTPANLTSTRFNNNGLIVADTRSTVEFGSGGGMIFANNGDVQVRSGTLSVLAHDTDASGPGADTGDYSVDAGASLRFRDAFRDFGPGSSITGAGNVEFTAFSGGAFNVNGVYSVGGTTRVSGNTLVNFNSNANFGTLDVAGNIGGGGTLNVGNLTWTSGSIGGAGRSIVVSGSTAMDGSSLTLNGARLTVAGSGLIDADTQLALNAGAQLIVGSGASLGLGDNSAVSGNGSVVNRGTLVGTVGTTEGTGSASIGVLLSNSGTVNASNGNLGLTGGIRTSAGSSFVIGNSGTMELGGELPDDIFDQIQISGSGSLSFSSAVQPVINRSFSAQAGTPFVFSLRAGTALRSGPLQGELTGQAAGWTYTAPNGFSGRDTAVFALSSGSGTALINVVFNVVSVPAVTTPIVQQVTVPLLQEVFQPPRMNVPSAPQVSSPVSIASLDALDNIATASGPQMEQPLRDFRGSRLQCR